MPKFVLTELQMLVGKVFRISEDTQKTDVV